MPRFSIVIPTYNRAALLGKAIGSVLRQTLTDLEVIVVDDGSADDTFSVVKEFQSDARVLYFRQANQGRSVARNQGAQMAHGQYLGFLDSDDEYFPDALESHATVIDQQSALGLTLGGVQYIDEGGGLLGQRQPWEESNDLSLTGWLFNCYAQPASALIQRDWFTRVGGFDASCEIAEDWDLYLRLANLACPSAWTRRLVCLYRQHPENSSRQLVLHRDGSLCSLEKLFKEPDLPPAVSSQKTPATAWVYVVFAHRAMVAGDLAWARENLAEALKLNPALATTGRMELLEFLFSPSYSGATPNRDALQSLAVHLELKPGELRQALARVEMQGFFRARRQGANGQAAQHLRAGLKYDFRWLANRGVLSFWLREKFNRA